MSTRTKFIGTVQVELSGLSVELEVHLFEDKVYTWEANEAQHLRKHNTHVLGFARLGVRDDSHPRAVLSTQKWREGQRTGDNEWNAAIDAAFELVDLSLPDAYSQSCLDEVAARIKALKR